MIIKKMVKIGGLASALLFSSLAFAGITVIDKLNFGTIAVLDNTTPSDITINSITNQIIITNGIRVLIPGNRAEFLLTDYPTYTQVFTSANIVIAETSSPTPPSEQFTLINLETVPSVMIDGTGFASVFVGGTLRTSGSGTGQYFDAVYTATYELEVNF